MLNQIIALEKELKGYTFSGSTQENKVAHNSRCDELIEKTEDLINQAELYREKLEKSLLVPAIKDRTKTLATMTVVGWGAAYFTAGISLITVPVAALLAYEFRGKSEERRRIEDSIEEINQAIKRIRRLKYKPHKFINFSSDMIPMPQKHLSQIFKEILYVLKMSSKTTYYFGITHKGMKIGISTTGALRRMDRGGWESWNGQSMPIPNLKKEKLNQRFQTTLHELIPIDKERTGLYDIGEKRPLFQGKTVYISCTSQESSRETFEVFWTESGFLVGQTTKTYERIRDVPEFTSRGGGCRRTGRYDTQRVGENIYYSARIYDSLASLNRDIQNKIQYNNHHEDFSQLDSIHEAIIQNKVTGSNPDF